MAHPLFGKKVPVLSHPHPQALAAGGQYDRRCNEPRVTHRQNQQKLLFVHTRNPSATERNDFTTRFSQPQRRFAIINNFYPHLL
jgi:hypothetical protein